MPDSEINIIKFDWDKNPMVNWICQDADGEWFGYEEKPIKGKNIWFPSNSGSHWEPIDVGEQIPNPKWEHTLTARPLKS